jgi:hypothetical protein
MNLTEIINRPDDQTLLQEEMEFVVEEYIFERKQRRVKIGIFPDPFFFWNEIHLLTIAFISASEWFRNNPKI